MDKIRINSLKEITKINSITEENNSHIINFETNRFGVVISVVPYISDQHLQSGRIMTVRVTQLSNPMINYTFKNGSWGSDTPNDVRNLGTKIAQSFVDYREKSG